MFHSDRKPCNFVWRVDEKGKHVRVSNRSGRTIPFPIDAAELEDGANPRRYKGTGGFSILPDFGCVSLLVFETFQIAQIRGVHCSSIPQSCAWTAVLTDGSHAPVHADVSFTQF